DPERGAGPDVSRAIDVRRRGVADDGDAASDLVGAESRQGRSNDGAGRIHEDHGLSARPLRTGRALDALRSLRSLGASRAGDSRGTGRPLCARCSSRALDALRALGSVGSGGPDTPDGSLRARGTSRTVGTSRTNRTNRTVETSRTFGTGWTLRSLRPL